MIPEIDAVDSPRSLLRIPPELDVPLTDRVRKIIDSQPLRRLSRVSQLGLVSLVYPGAVHSRFEHSLGVYRLGLIVLRRLLQFPEIAASLDQEHVEAFVLATLLHDVGHWPFCHPIEDMNQAGVPRHEELARKIICTSEMAELIERDWNCSASQVCNIIENRIETSGEALLASLLSGPIDVDKMDYLIRDSLHAGVPYGRNFDLNRLISAFQKHPDADRIAISEKGRTAAEMMVFARYVMFSEVYWHHAVRSATAMLQRAIFLLRGKLELSSMMMCGDAEWIEDLRRVAEGTLAGPLVEGLFGSHRRLLKRLAQFDVIGDPSTHLALAHRPYEWLAEASGRLADYFSARTGTQLGAEDVIIDAPPVKLEVDIRVDVVTPIREGGIDDRLRVMSLGEVSPVVRILAQQQFDGHVKRVRVFVREDVRDKLGFLAAEDLFDALSGAGFDLSPVAVRE